MTACAVTSDGRRVVFASEDHTLKVWDLETGRALATLQGHASEVTACAVTPDGRRVVSASADHTLKVWDLDSGACLLTHRASVASGAVTATEVTVIAGDAIVGRRPTSSSGMGGGAYAASLGSCGTRTSLRKPQS